MLNIDWSQTENLLKKNIRFIENSKKISADVNKLRTLNETDYRLMLCEDGASITIEKNTDAGYIRFHSAYEPHREGQLLAQKIVTEDSREKIYLRFGFGFGYLFNYLLPLTENQDSIVIIYEPSYDIFNYFIRLFDISKLFTGYSVRLFVGDSMNDVRKMFPYLHDAPRAETSKYCSLSYSSSFKDEIDGCSHALEKFYRDGQLNRNTQRFFAEKWAVNTISNIPFIFKSPWYKGFKGLLEGKPAILVSAGPSLNKNIHLLREVQGKVFIAAAYVTVKTFEANGIKPDMLMALDGVQAPYTVNNDYDFLDIPLVLHANVPRSMFEHHKENNFIFLDGTTVLSKMVERTGKTIEYVHITGGTVALGVANLLKYMGAGTIILMGQDLALTGGSHHAKEYTEGNETVTEDWMQERLVQYKKIMVEDVYGEQVETTQVLDGFRRQFEDFAESNESIKMIDATEGGAKIAHTTIMTFREAMDTYMAEYKDDTFTAKLINQARENGEFLDKDEKLKMIDILKDMVNQCIEIEELTDDALKAGEKVLNLFRFNKIPTNKELAKPYIKYRSILVEKILKNDLVITAINPKFTANFIEADALRREDDHEAHFFVRHTSEMLVNQRELVKDFQQKLEETLEEISKEGV